MPFSAVFTPGEGLFYCIKIGRNIDPACGSGNFLTETYISLRRLENAAQNGNDYAAYRLGKEYYRGKNVERSFTVAAKWFSRAADQGNQYAQYMLGKLYLMGQGLEYNKELGIHWLSQSAAQ